MIMVFSTYVSASDSPINDNYIETFINGNRTFSYTKIANDGSELTKDAKFGKGKKDWACTRDNNTGLIWELKTNDGGLRDLKNTYSNHTKNYPEYCTTRECYPSKLGDNTNADGFIKQVNKTKLCGKDNWRLPDINELVGLIYCPHGEYTKDGDFFNYEIIPSYANTKMTFSYNICGSYDESFFYSKYFPDIPEDRGFNTNVYPSYFYFWTSTPIEVYEGPDYTRAMTFNANNSVVNNAFVNDKNHIRLVQGITKKGNTNEEIKSFSYTKIANDGSVLPNSAKLGRNSKDWACTKDNNTGLIWEVKTDDNGLRDKKWYYSWYNPKKDNGGDRGYTDIESSWMNKPINCISKNNCNTYSFTSAVNKKGLCGKKDWRLPNKDELMTLIYCSNGKYGYQINNFSKELRQLDSCSDSRGNWSTLSHPTINTTYFPDSPLQYYSGRDENGDVQIENYPSYWSSSPDISDSYGAWFINFYYGFAEITDKYANNYIRLVRGK